MTPLCCIIDHMKTDYFTKTALTLIVVSLAIIAGEMWTTSANVVHATPTRTWEYKTVDLIYQYKQGSNQGYATSPSLDGYVCHEDSAKATPCDDFLKRLGAQGWELVCVYPDSTTSGPAMAGVTTSATYMFKR